MIQAKNAIWHIFVAVSAHIDSGRDAVQRDMRVLTTYVFTYMYVYVYAF